MIDSWGWQYKPSRLGKDGTDIIILSGNRIIAEIICPIKGDEAEIAGLIASAPDLLAENARLKKLNREMVELIRFFEFDVDYMLGQTDYLPRNYAIDWESRKVKISNILVKARGEGE